MSSDQLTKSTQGLSRGLLLLLAVVAGFMVSNIYYGQPLLERIGFDLSIPRGEHRMGRGIITSRVSCGGAGSPGAIGRLGGPPHTHHRSGGSERCGCLWRDPGFLRSCLAACVRDTGGVGLIRCTGHRRVHRRLQYPGQKGRKHRNCHRRRREWPHPCADRGRWHDGPLGVGGRFTSLPQLLLWSCRWQSSAPCHGSRHQGGEARYWQAVSSVVVLTRRNPVFRTRALITMLLFASFGVLWSGMSLLLSGPRLEPSAGRCRAVRACRSCRDTGRIQGRCCGRPRMGTTGSRASVWWRSWARGSRCPWEIGR